jgi:hypothetical protein
VFGASSACGFPNGKSKKFPRHDQSHILLAANTYNPKNRPEASNTTLTMTKLLVCLALVALAATETNAQQNRDALVRSKIDRFSRNGERQLSKGSKGTKGSVSSVGKGTKGSSGSTAFAACPAGKMDGGKMDGGKMDGGDGGKMYGGKMDASAFPSAAPSLSNMPSTSAGPSSIVCPCPAGKMSGGKMSGGKMDGGKMDGGKMDGGKMDGSACASPAVAGTLMCGYAFTGAVSLTSPLECTTATALTLDGADAVLDCGGNLIFADAIVSGSIGILLQNGATAINCMVSGFETGVSMDGGDNTLQDSTIFDNGIGVVTSGDSGDGSMTIQGVVAFANDNNGASDAGDGVRVGSSGAISIVDLESMDNFNDGLSFYVPTGTKLDASVEGLNLLSAGEDNLEVAAEESTESGAGGAGAITLTFMGENKITEANTMGLRLAGPEGIYNLGGVLDISGNGDRGIILTAGTVIFPPDSVATVCNNEAATSGTPTDIDLDVGEAINQSGQCTPLVCGNVDDNIGSGLVCEQSCPDKGTVPVFQCV